MAPEYSVVIPVYNSTQSLIQLTDSVLAVFREQIKASVEIIMVDDASPNPDTWPTMQQLAGSHPEVKALQLMRNFGKPGALYCAMEQARGKYIITLDDDLQHNPADIPQLLQQKHHDVVIGSFAKLEQPYFFKRLSSRMYDYFLQVAFDKPRHLKNTPFKVIKAQVVQEMLRIRTPNPSVVGLLFFVTRDIVNVEVEHGRRQYGNSGYTFLKMLQNMFNLMINNSSVMLRLVALVGTLISSASFLLGIFFIIKRLTGQSRVSGWTSLVVISLFTSGLILFSVGIIGEYLIRIISGIEKRPAYIVRQRAGEEDQ